VKITFRVYGLPQTKGSTKSFYVKALKRVVTTNDNKKNKAWAQCVSEVASQHRPPALLLGPLQLDAIFHMPKPKSLPKRKPSWPAKKPDADKLLRSLGDSLTGVIWRDDAQVVDCAVKKIYSDAPGVDVTITTIEEEGALPL
jgi:Holliday junction resolvase RusA-like endonuclease